VKRKTLGELPIMSIENPTLAHFRHFSSLFANLRAYKAPVICLQSSVFCLESCVCCLWSANGPSTSVENPLQIGLFMQNKPNFRKAKMRLSCLYTKDYQNFIPLAGYKNKPNSNPIKPNFSKNPKWTQTLFYKRIMKMNHLLAPKKQSQNKPNQSLSWAHWVYSECHRREWANFRKAQNDRKLICYRGLWKWNRLQAQKKKPKTNPILSAVGGFRKAKMNLKSLAGKSA